MVKKRSSRPVSTRKPSSRPAPDALGVEEVDTGALRTTTEIMERRDRRRAQADEPEPSE